LSLGDILLEPFEPTELYLRVGSLLRLGRHLREKRIQDYVLSLSPVALFYLRRGSTGFEPLWVSPNAAQLLGSHREPFTPGSRNTFTPMISPGSSRRRSC